MQLVVSVEDGVATATAVETIEPVAALEPVDAIEPVEATDDAAVKATSTPVLVFAPDLLDFM